jgi:hypothetical protein
VHHHPLELPLVCGWIPTESSSWVSHWLTFLCQEI